MLTYDLLHPDHIVPTAELISAFMKFPDLCISEMFMKFGTVLRQILILRRRISDNTCTPFFFEIQVFFVIAYAFFFTGIQISL